MNDTERLIECVGNSLRYDRKMFKSRILDAAAVVDKIGSCTRHLEGACPPYSEVINLRYFENKITCLYELLGVEVRLANGKVFEINVVEKNEIENQK